MTTASFAPLHPGGWLLMVRDQGAQPPETCVGLLARLRPPLKKNASAPSSPRPGLHKPWILRHFKTPRPVSPLPAH